MPRLFVYLFVQFVFKLRSKSDPLYFDLFLKLIPGGVTAITACAPAIKANQQEVSFAVANVVAFGTIGMLVYPYLAHSMLGSSQAIGTFLGLAIHDTSQVVSCLSFRPVLLVCCTTNEMFFLLFLLHLFFCFSSFFIIFFIFVVHNRSLSIYLFFSHLLILKDGRSIDVQRSVS